MLSIFLTVILSSLNSFQVLELSMETMILLILSTILVTIVTTHAHFTCPEMAQSCVCKEETAWWTIENEYKQLKIVNCSFKSLDKIPDLSSFKGRPFHRLLLNNNNISHVERKYFSGISVKEINLRRNPIRKIDSDSFQDLQETLEILDMDSVRLKIVQGLPFLRGLSNLKVLDLGYNQVTKQKYKTFPPNIFSNFNLSSIRTLTLQALQMEKLEEGAFRGIEHLEQLDLSYNFLSEFPVELKRLNNLKDLKLYSNEIQILENNTFAGMTSLRQLLIGVNEIDTIEAEAFNDLNNSIEEINLYHNPLFRVPSVAIQDLRKLKKLSLVKTQLGKISNGSFQGEYRLKELHLDDNPKISFADDGMFHGIEGSLEVLFLRTLGLERLPLNVLRRLEKLFYLDATDNVIQKIDKHFFNGLKLSNVKLMWNNIKHIDPRAFREFDKGVKLSLRHNSISDISFVLDIKPCTFDEIDFTENRIPCDCTLEKVLNSGLVSWQILGHCFVENGDTVNWYSFQDKQLMDYLWAKCSKTTPSARCIQSTSGTGSLHSNSIICTWLLACFLLIVYRCCKYC